MFRRIVCATDLTDASDAALALALRLGRETDSSVDLLHVVEPPYSSRGLFQPISQAETELLVGLARRHEDAARKIMAEQVKRLTPPDREGGRVELHVRQGLPSDVIVATATELGAGLIVTGTHGRTGLKHAILGSIAERVVRTAACPVLVARAQ